MKKLTEKVLKILSDGKPRTVKELVELTEYSDASVSAVLNALKFKVAYLDTRPRKYVIPNVKPAKKTRGKV